MNQGNAGAGAPLGNQNAAKGRLVEKALLREIKQRDLKAGDGETLRAIAAKLVDAATEGDLMAFREMADRLDGKPKQAVELSSDPDSPVIVQHVTARESIESLVKAE